MCLKRLKIYRASLFLILFSVISHSELRSQNYPVRTYGVSEGLPQSTINSIRQDSRGFIWISTRNGLARFDGMETVNYFKRNGLASNHVLITFEDLNKGLWALTTSGLSYFNGNEFIPFHLPENITRIFPPVAISADSTIYFLSAWKGRNIRELFSFKNGIYSRFGEDHPFFDSLDLSQFTYDKEVSSLIVRDVKGNLWAVNERNVNRVTDSKVDILYTFQDESRFKSADKLFRYSNGYAEELTQPDIEQNGGSFVIMRDLVRGALLTFHSWSDTALIRLPVEDAGYIIDNEGVLWYYSGSFLNRLKSPLFYLIDQSVLPFPALWAISEDMAGDLWFGSIYGRLMKFTGNQFIEVTEFINTPAGRLAFYKGSRRMSNGDIWFSTDYGIIVYDGSDFTWHKAIAADAQVCYIYEDTSDGIIMAGTNKGLYIIKNGEVILRKEFLDNYLGVIEGIEKNESGGYWLSGHMGLVRLDGDVATPVRFPGLPEENTFTLIADKMGGLWITSDEGLWYRDSKTGEYRPALPEEMNKPANSILAIDGNRIIAGRTTDICMIYLDRYYRGESDYFRIYDNTDGFMGNVCLDNGIIKARDGKIWILTNNEIVRFNPDGIKINTKPPDLHITGVYYKDDSNQWISAEAGNLFYNNPSVVNLTRKQNNIRIAYTGISTTNPEKVRYVHRLTGLEREWSLPTLSRAVNYDNLSPGNYTFEITAMNADGIQSPLPQKIELRIEPAFWQRPIFIIFISLLSLLLTAFVTWLFLRRKQKEKEESQKLRIALSRLQLKAVLRQFDPHFTFNVISSVGSLVMKNEKEAAYEYITRLSNLLRSVISEERLIIMSIAEEIEFVTGYCELQKLRFRERFNYEIEVDPEVDKTRLIPRMTIQSFVENAIKHGIENSRSGGKLWIEVKKLNDSLEIKIRDNGIGRASAGRLKTTGTGTGLKTISLLFDYVNGFNAAKCYFEISDISEQGMPSGTLVKIVIPDICDFNILDFRESETSF